MKFEIGWWFPDHDRHFKRVMQWHDKPLNNRPSYQGDKQAMCLAYCKQRRRAIDIGAHVGLWSWNLAQSFEHVEAFEPLAEHRECFDRNVAGLDNVTLHPVALGDAPRMVSITRVDGNSGAAFVDGDGDIPMRCLDDFDFSDVDFIKIDTQEYERRILAGSVKTIKRNRPVMCIEDKATMRSSVAQEDGPLQFMRRMGYEVVSDLYGDYIMVPR